MYNPNLKLICFYQDKEAIYFNTIIFDEKSEDWMVDILPIEECSNCTQLKRVPYRSIQFLDKEMEQKRKKFFVEKLAEIEKELFFLTLINNLCLN